MGSRSNAAGATPNGIWNWPSAVNWLLRSYARDDALDRALTALRTMSQNPGEEEDAYMQRLTNAHARCGYPLQIDDFAARFVDGLDPRIRSLVRRYRSSNPGADLLELVEEAGTEGAAMRARSAKRPSAYSRGQPTKLANYLDTDGDPIFFASDESERAAEASLSVLAHSKDAMEVALALERGGSGRTVPAPALRGRSAVPRPGWYDPGGAYHGVVCHQCYLLGAHYKPDCSIDPRTKPDVIVMNFEKLTLATKLRVPWDSYLRVTGRVTAIQLGMKGIVRVLLADGQETGPDTSQQSDYTNCSSDAAGFSDATALSYFSSR
eukprot:IDg4452t1